MPEISRNLGMVAVITSMSGEGICRPLGCVGRLPIIPDFSRWVFGIDQVLPLVRRRGDTGRMIGDLYAAAEQERPQPQGSDLAAKSWPIALQILKDDEVRPPRGYGRLMKISRLVNAKLQERYKDDSVRRAIGPSVREWESRNPRK
jgi:hypothetical protein